MHRGIDAGDEGGAIDFTGANVVDTDGGLVAIGSSFTQSIEFEGTLDTTGGDFGEDGLVGFYAGDASGQDDLEQRFGAGRIEIGGGVPTSIDSGGVTLEARDVLTDSGVIAGTSAPACSSNGV